MRNNFDTKKDLLEINNNELKNEIFEILEHEKFNHFRKSKAQAK